MADFIEYITEQNIEYLKKIDRVERKKIGQFFTSPQCAKFMASLFDLPNKSSISILDPGAGSGILSAAILQRIEKEKLYKEVTLICYEISEISELLRSNLSFIQENVSFKLTFVVKQENYITTQHFDGLFPVDLYDVVISNPPYLKIAKEAVEAVAMSSVCYGTPNMYFLFMAMAMNNLKEGGQLVFIIPRSWTSGVYFKAFRNYFLNCGKLLQIHLFDSRKKVFTEEAILQETIIVKAQKTRINPPEIVITSSLSVKDFDDVQKIVLPYTVVVSEKSKYVFLITSQTEYEILSVVNNFDYTLPSIGLKMKTGLTVDFRSRELLYSSQEMDTVPLFYSQHIKDGKIVFPISKEGEYIKCVQASLIQENKNYLFVKRFTAKEEFRRLQCGIYLSEEFPQYLAISTQNKLNFIDSIDKSALTKFEVFGLYVIFNSTIYDCYYRILNGSTQVNSTEINFMPIPNRNYISKMGYLLQQHGDLSTIECDNILNTIL